MRLFYNWFSVCLIVCLYLFGCKTDDTEDTQPVGSGIPSEGRVVWLSSDTGLVMNDLNQVKTWKSKTGTLTVSQPDSVKWPLLKEDPVSHLKFIHFDGSDDFLQTELPLDLLNSSRSFSVFVVVRPGKSQKMWADILDYNHETDINFVIQQNRLDVNNFGFYGGGDGGSQVLDSLTINLFSAVAIGKDSLDYTWLNGKNQKSARYVNRIFKLPARFTVGNKTDSKYYRQFNGDIFEILIYSRALSDSELNKVHTYLKLKYKISG